MSQLHTVFENGTTVTQSSVTAASSNLTAASVPVSLSRKWVEFFNNRDWPLASAVAIVLLLVLVLPIAWFQRSQQRREAEDEKA